LDDERLVLRNMAGKLLTELQVQEMFTPDEQHGAPQAFQVGGHI